MTEATFAVRVAGLSKSFGNRPVLSGVDLSVETGALAVLLGASGAGKSTLLRIVAGLETADAGRVEVSGRVVADPRPLVPPERRGVAMVFQTLELWPHMTAAENVAFGLPGRPRGLKALGHPRVVEVAAEVGLPHDLLARTPPTLSGGERQRVAIARALAPKPAVVLYDEPLANLDPARRADLRALLRSLRARRVASMLYVTHDASEALEMGDSVAVLDGGRVVDLGPPASLYLAARTFPGARALGTVSVVPAKRVGDAIDSALGSFPAGNPGAPPGEVAAVGVRPEQVVPARDGSLRASVVDAYPTGPDWAFSARLSSSGVLLHGRSPSALSVGAEVSLSVTGTPLVFSSMPASAAGDAA